MSELETLGQKIDQSNSKIDKLIETMTTFVAFQARAEERHDSTSRRLIKLEDVTSTLWDMVHRNALFVNGAVFIVTSIGIWFIKGLIDGN